MTERYELYYWPTSPGRGEFVRLVLEEAGAPYRDVARLPEAESGGIDALMTSIRRECGGQATHAPPILVLGELVLARMATIFAFLGERHGLVPDGPRERMQVLQLQLTIADVVDETHNSHHPVSVGLRYEDQKKAARRAARHFLAERLPRFLSYLGRVLERNGGEWLVGDSLSYADLSLFQLLTGLAYAFPRGFAKLAVSTPELLSLRDRVSERPRIAAYLVSDRRIAFNEQGIFRRYPELDLSDSRRANRQAPFGKTSDIDDIVSGGASCRPVAPRGVPFKVEGWSEAPASK
jgi:glutathione S-transferase